MATGSISVFAPAKINLHLHVTGRRDDGYHLIDSLVVFADIGDKILIEPSDQFSFQINGQFAPSFIAMDRDDSEQSTNLAVRAARLLAKAQDRDLNYRITLTKNLPLAAGIGGGSSDAAAVLWGLMRLWDIDHKKSPWLHDLTLKLGADVPSCLRCAPVRMQGIGDRLTYFPGLPEIFMILIHPGKNCPTAEIFKRFSGPIRGDISIPQTLQKAEDLISFIKDQHNDLTPAAIEIVPEIAEMISALEQQENCLISRMSGSGASVFGLFKTMEDAQNAAEHIALSRPGWWVRTGTINRPIRY